MSEDYGEVLGEYVDIIYDKVDSGKLTIEKSDKLLEKLNEWGRVYFLAKMGEGGVDEK